MASSSFNKYVRIDKKEEDIRIAGQYSPELAKSRTRISDAYMDEAYGTHVANAYTKSSDGNVTYSNETKSSSWSATVQSDAGASVSYNVLNKNNAGFSAGAVVSDDMATAGINRHYALSSTSMNGGVAGLRNMQTNTLIYKGGDVPFVVGATTDMYKHGATFYNAAGGGNVSYRDNTTVQYGANILGDMNQGYMGGGVKVGIDREKNFIIPVGGYGANATVGTSANNFMGTVNVHATKALGDYTQGTSDKMTSLRVGVGLSAGGFPTGSLEFLMLRNGMVRKVDPVAMLNILNPPGLVLAWVNAFRPQKVDIPQFEIIRPDDTPAKKPHNDMFNGDLSVLTMGGKAQLDGMVKNVINHLSKTPNDKITLELGDYLSGGTMFSSISNEINQQRKEAVKQHIVAYLQANAPELLERINISTEITKVSPDDKRLNLNDTHNNIKIVSENAKEMAFVGAQGEFHFKQYRASPAGEAQFQTMKNGELFQKFVSENKLSDNEAEMLANFSYHRINEYRNQTTLSDEQHLAHVLKEAKEQMYDKGFSFEKAMTATDLKTVTKDVLTELQQNSDIMTSLREAHPNMSEKQFKKEVNNVAKYISELAVSNSGFKAELEEFANMNGRPASPMEVIELGLRNYQQAFIEKGLSLNNIDEIMNNAKKRLMSLKDDDVDIAKLSPAEVLLREQLIMNSKAENRELVDTLVNVAFQQGKMPATSGELANIFKDGFYEHVYKQGHSLLENNGKNTNALIGVLKGSGENNDYVQCQSEGFNKEWDNLKFDKKEAQALIDKHPELRDVHGQTALGLVTNLKDTMTSVYPLLEKQAISGAEKMSHKERIIAEQPPLGTLLKGAVAAIEAGVNPEELRDTLPVLLARAKNPKFNEENITSGLNPQVAQIVMNTVVQPVLVEDSQRGVEFKAYQEQLHAGKMAKVQAAQAAFEIKAAETQELKSKTMAAVADYFELPEVKRNLMIIEEVSKINPEFNKQNIPAFETHNTQKISELVGKDLWAQAEKNIQEKELAQSQPAPVQNSQTVQVTEPTVQVQQPDVSTAKVEVQQPKSENTTSVVQAETPQSSSFSALKAATADQQAVTEEERIRMEQEKLAVSQRHTVQHTM